MEDEFLDEIAKVEEIIESTICEEKIEENEKEVDSNE